MLSVNIPHVTLSGATGHLVSRSLRSTVITHFVSELREARGELDVEAVRRVKRLLLRLRFDSSMWAS